ncbi:hypothetical protein [Streptomyces albicerus]|jgi:hypothetical protein|uniref:hypothetical protein n=1 Tax=Streptomyces albicerus TaxID=2569859 RepID=UPI00124BADE1|nr:hypothetical protein [Streptomyces albicerus]
MTRRIRNRKTVVVAAVLAAAGIAGGGVALAADGDEAPREEIRLVVEEGASDNSGTSTWSREDCPEKDGSGGTTPSEDPSNPAAAL